MSTMDRVQPKKNRLLYAGTTAIRGFSDRTKGK